MKNLITILFIAVISISLFSCNKKTEKVITTAKDTTVKKETVKETEIKNTVFEGTWISTEDSKSKVQVKANNWIEMYEGEKTDTLRFAVGDSCLANINAKAKPNGKDIPVFDPDGKRCFLVVNVNDAKLELSYVGRGNTLTYKKKK
jgi:hypothetical protein